MNIIEIVLISLSLSADAWSVATCKGISVGQPSIKDATKIALIFGMFQMLMPILGFFLGNGYFFKIINYSNVVIFVILLIVGIRMIIDSQHKETINSQLNIKELIILGIATSIDAFAVGLTFSLKRLSLFIPIITIGVTTFTLSLLGYLLGNKIGFKYQRNALLIAGLVLIILSFKYLLKL